MPYYKQDITSLRQTNDSNYINISDNEINIKAKLLQNFRLKAINDWQNGAMPIIDLAFKNDDFSIINKAAKYYRDNFKEVVILGTGGSSLGAEALYNLINSKYGNDSNRLANSPKLRIVTNIDPFNFDEMLSNLDLKNTGFLVISKSGATSETVLQFLNIISLFLNDGYLNNKIADHIKIIVENNDNPISRLANKYNIETLEHANNIGGRYSVLSIVGMLPAAIVGIDIKEVRAGAASVWQELIDLGGDITNHPAIISSILLYLLDVKHKINCNVMLAYSDRLGSLVRWHRQLWAESLGKGGFGTTPIYAMGPVDQHSQLQLWLDGPNDKVFTIMGGNITKGKIVIDSDLISGDKELQYLVGNELGSLMNASRKATISVLKDSNKPLRIIDANKLEPINVGALMMHFMLETIFSAALYGIDPYNQPAVEDGKILMRKIMLNKK